MNEPYLMSYDGTAPKREAVVDWSDQIHRIKLVLRRYWWVLCVTVMIGLGIQDYLTLYHVTLYNSTARMIVSGQVAVPGANVYSESEQISNFQGTQASLMKSNATLNQAVDRVFSTHPEVIADVNALVDVSVEPKTSIFNLRVTSSDPDYARLLLDAIMDTYLYNKKGRRNQTTDEALSAITEEISRLDADIKHDDQELLDFQKQNNVVFIEEQSSSSAAYLVGLNNELARLVKERDLLALESKDPLLGSGFVREPGNSASSPDSAAPGSASVPEHGAATTTNAGSTTSPENGSPATTSPVESGSTPFPSTPISNKDSNPSGKSDADASTELNSTKGGDSTGSNPILFQQDSIEKLKITRDQLGVYLKDKHPKMIQLADQIEQEQKFLDVLNKRNSSSRDAAREDLDLQIKNLQQQIEVSNNNSLKLSESLATYQELKSKISRQQSLYNQLALSIQNVDFNKSLDQNDVIILEAASKAIPVPQETPLNFALAIGGGLAAGALIIYLVSLFDDKINSTSQLEEKFNLPIMGQIPRAVIDKRTKRVALLGENDARHDFLEYHRNLRSAILFQSSEAPKLGSLMVCSAAPGEGKSTLSSDMAIVFAQSGLRVLLIDADLRRGVLHTLFDLSGKPGLADYLEGQVTWPEIVQETKNANLSLMPRGNILSHSGDLLLSSATDILIQESTSVFDLVLWDSAPLLATNDAANLCHKMDGVIFVARVRRSTIRSVRAALDDLIKRNAKVLGFVLNAVEYHRPGYGRKYRYKEYYETTPV